MVYDNNYQHNDNHYQLTIKMKKSILTFFLFISFAFTSHAGNFKVIELRIQNHQFVPNIINLAENEKAKLIIHNDDETIEEFESFDLKREKLIPAGKKVTVVLKPMKPGTYEFFGEFHEDTAKGKIIVK